MAEAWKDWTAEAFVASSLPSWPFFPCLSSAFRTDSLVLAICDPLTGIIDGEKGLNPSTGLREWE